MAYMNLEEQKKKMADYLASQDAIDEKQRQDYLASQKPMTSDVMGLQLNPSERMAFGERLGVENKKLSQERESGLSLMAMKQKQQNFNKLFNYAFDKYINAGYDVEQAQNFSKIWADNIQNQTWQAEDAKKSRDLTEAKSTISGLYGDIKSGMGQDNSDPYTQAAMRALFGLGGTYATGQILSNKAEQDRRNKYGFGGDQKATVTPYPSSFAGTGDTSKYENY